MGGGPLLESHDFTPMSCMSPKVDRGLVACLFKAVVLDKIF